MQVSHEHEGGHMSDEDQDDFDSACHQKELEERQCRELDPALLTTPMKPWPRLTPKEQFEVEMAKIRQLEWALRRIWK